MITAKPTGRATSTPKGLLWGTGVCMISTVMMAGILAGLIERKLVQQGYLGYGVMILLPVSAFLGAMVSHRKIKRKKFIVSMATGILYFIMLLLVCALFFGGNYAAVPETGIMIGCGALLYAIFELPNKKKGRKSAYY